MSALENNNNMLSHGNSESGSDSNSPVQYTISPTQASVSTAFTSHQAHFVCFSFVAPIPLSPRSQSPKKSKRFSCWNYDFRVLTQAVQPGPDCLEPRGVLTQDPAPDYPLHHGQTLQAAAHSAHSTHSAQPSGQVTPTGSYSSVAAGTNSNSSTAGGGVSGGNGSVVGIQATPSLGGVATNGSYDPHVVHGSTPLGQIGANVCPIPVDTSSIMSGTMTAISLVGFPSNSSEYRAIIPGSHNTRRFGRRLR